MSSWLPLEPLRFCFVHTQCKLIVLDSDRADTIEPIVASLSQDVGSVGLLVLNSHEGKGRWTGMDCYRAAVDRYIGGTQGIQSLNQDIEILPEDNAAIMFTSGTALRLWHATLLSYNHPYANQVLPAFRRVY